MLACLRGWVAKKMGWLAPHEGRPSVFLHVAIQFCLTIKREGRHGNLPLACFCPERAAPRVVHSSAQTNKRDVRQSAALGRSGLGRSRSLHAMSQPNDARCSAPVCSTHMLDRQSTCRAGDRDFHWTAKRSVTRISDDDSREKRKARLT